MTDARERLEEAGAERFKAYGKDFSEPANRREYVARPLLDSFLAHPDDLIACLVERGALEQVGWSYRGVLYLSIEIDGAVPVYVMSSPVVGAADREETNG